MRGGSQRAIRRYVPLAVALAAPLGPAQSAAADDSCASPAEPPVLTPGQAVCDNFRCADMQVWIDGRPVGIVPPAGAAMETAQCADRAKEMVVRLMPPSNSGANLVARVDLAADGFQDAHATIHLDGTGATLRVVMHRKNNLRLTLQGDGAAATGYAVVDGQTIDRCAVDGETGHKSCEMYVPPGRGDISHASVKIVGTASFEVPALYFRRGVVTELVVSAPRTSFPWYEVAGLALIPAVGLAASAGFATAGENKGGDIGFDLVAAGITAVSLAGAYLIVDCLERTYKDFTVVYQYPDHQESHPTWAPALTSRAVRAHPASGPTASGLGLQW